MKIIKYYSLLMALKDEELVVALNDLSILQDSANLNSS